MQRTLANRSVRGAIAPQGPTIRRTTILSQVSVSRFSRKALCTVAQYAPPTVSDTKAKFINSYRKPIASIYNTILQELLVQQHFIRYHVNYKYSEIVALGLVSVFDQVMEGIPEQERSKIFDAFITSVQENPETYRKAASALEAAASSLSGPDDLTPSADGNVIQRALADVAAQSAEGKFAYNRFFAIGLFRLLELTGAKEPAALEKLVKASGARTDQVNRDLMMYKNVLSKLSSAKELMKEFLEREKRKQQEREQAKAAKQAEGQSTETPAVQQA